MNDAIETKKLYKKFFLRSIPLYVLAIIAFIVFACSFGLYAEYIRKDRNMDVNNVIQADVTSISQIPHGATSHGYSNNWNVYYEYNDGKFLYRGSVVTEKETAEASLYGTIPIYIDGHGHCETVNEYNWRKESGATKRALIIGIVFSICFGIFTLLSVLLLLIQRRKIKNLKTACDIEADKEQQ